MIPDIKYSIENKDAVEYLKSIQDESIDLVITDPPYESIEKHRSRGTTTRLKHSKGSSNDWFQIFSNDRFLDLFVEIYRVLKKDAHFYLFSDSETMFYAKPRVEMVGFKFWKPLVWDKVKIGMGYHYRARYEFILFFEKGKKKLKNLGVPDILTAPRIFGGYPAQKPVEILQTLVNQSTEPGDIVCDPFFGSGSTGVAALRLLRNFTGNDISSDAFELARTNLTNAGICFEQGENE